MKAASIAASTTTGTRRRHASGVTSNAPTSASVPRPPCTARPAGASNVISNSIPASSASVSAQSPQRSMRARTAT